MIQLYHAGGATDLTILTEGLAMDKSRVLLENAAGLLTMRGNYSAAALLRSVSFHVVEATNHLDDEFLILHATVALEEYEKLRRGLEFSPDRQAYVKIADVLAELGTYVRFIVAELATEHLCFGLTSDTTCGINIHVGLNRTANEGHAYNREMADQHSRA